MTKHDEAPGVVRPGQRPGSARFAVACAMIALACAEEPVAPPVLPTPAPVTGSVLVLAVIEGKDLDPDGFVVRVDGGEPRTVSNAQSALFADLAPGSHSVQAEGIAENCMLREPNPYLMIVAAGEIRTVVINVDCLTHGTGAVRVRVNRGFERFGISIGDSVVNTTDGTILVTDLAPGPYAVQLHLDPGECTMHGENPTMTSVVAGRIKEISFVLLCVLTVKVTTLGANQPAGYTAYIEQVGDYYCEASCYGMFVNATGAIEFELSPVWEYRVTLRNVPPNCTAMPAEHKIAVPPRERATLTFAVTCR
jgi:hypothetical protein